MGFHAKFAYWWAVTDGSVLAAEKKLASEICPRVGICKSPEVRSFSEGLLQDQNKANAKHSGNLPSQQSARLTGLSWQWFG